jgi:hypothetical protein
MEAIMSRRTFPAGVYTAQAVRSWITWTEGCAEAFFRFEILDGRHKGKNFNIKMIVQHPHPKIEKRGRDALGRIASTVEVGDFNDTEALHRKPLLMYLWKFKPLHGITASVWTCEPIDGTGVKSAIQTQYTT